jgi:hypothetical protein
VPIEAQEQLIQTLQFCFSKLNPELTSLTLLRSILELFEIFLEALEVEQFRLMFGLP